MFISAEIGIVETRTCECYAFMGPIKVFTGCHWTKNEYACSETEDTTTTIMPVSTETTSPTTFPTTSQGIKFSTKFN